MFCWHKWGMWVEVSSFRNDKYAITLVHQKRICEKCGKVQLREVLSG